MTVQEERREERRNEESSPGFSRYRCSPAAFVCRSDVRSPRECVVEKWSVEMGSIGMLARAGWRRDTVKPGDEITVIGNRAKDGKTFLRLSKLVFSNGQELTTTVQ